MKAGSKKRTADSMMAKEGADGSGGGNGDTATAALVASSGGDGAPVVDDLEAKRRKDVLKDMEKIEREFADLKEKLFAKKMKDLHDECKAIMEGTLHSCHYYNFCHSRLCRARVNPHLLWCWIALTIANSNSNDFYNLKLHDLCRPALVFF